MFFQLFWRLYPHKIYHLSNDLFFLPFFIPLYLHIIIARFIATFSTCKPCKQTRNIFVFYEIHALRNTFIAFVLSKVYKQHHKSTDKEKLKAVFLHKVIQILINYLPIKFTFTPFIKHRPIKFTQTFPTSTF